MKKTVILLFILTIAAVLFSFPTVAVSKDPLSAAGFLSFRNKEKAPDFMLHDVNETPTELGAFRGKIVLLYFWTTW